MEMEIRGEEAAVRRMELELMRQSFVRPNSVSQVASKSTHSNVQAIGDTADEQVLSTSAVLEA